jgi:uracil-DNA glycosylase
MNKKKGQMRLIRDEVLALPPSELVNFRRSTKSLPVIGEGDHDASIIFIGEAPGKNEAGVILDDLLLANSLRREDVYITNIVKDRPPGNRDPLPEEIELYSPYLDRQLEIISPRIIVTLGRFSMIYIMERAGLKKEIHPISSAHGKSIKLENFMGIKVLLPLYHPAAAIYNRELIAALREDFKKLKSLLAN